MTLLQRPRVRYLRLHATAVLKWALPLHAVISSSQHSSATTPQKNAETCWVRENVARVAFEQCTGHVFEKVRPKFLKNPHTGRNLELDGYCAQLKIGWETDGKQHTIFPNAFHRSAAEFHAQQARDRIKEDLCKKAGVTLIRVPHEVEFDSIHSYVKEQLQKHNVPTVGGK